MAETIFEFRVNECPICSKAHDYEFTVRTLSLFAGKTSEQEQLQSFELIVPCFNEDDEYKVAISVPRPPNQKIVSVRRREQ
jgi:hypothetical protein